MYNMHGKSANGIIIIVINNIYYEYFSWIHKTLKWVSKNSTFNLFSSTFIRIHIFMTNQSSCTIL